MVTINLDWTYTPKEYFEQPFVIEVEGIEITLDKGRIEVILDAQVFDQDPSISKRLDRHVRAMFMGIKLLSHKKFTLSQVNVVRVNPDGPRIVYGSALLTATASLSVKVDTKAERIAQKREFAKKIAELWGKDELLDAMVNSYSKAVDDPKNELVYLYEVCDSQRSFQFSVHFLGLKILLLNMLFHRIIFFDHFIPKWGL